MLKNMFTWIFIFPLVILLVVFSLVNLNEIAVNVWVDYQISVPVYAIFWAGLLIGLLVGLISTWLGTRNIRQQVAELEKENKSYRESLEDAHKEQTKLKARMFDVADKKEKPTPEDENTD